MRPKGGGDRAHPSWVPAAVLTSSPAVGVKLPRVDRPKVRPLELDQVLALAEAMPARARAAVLFAAGSGLRMGEMLGLTVDRVDFLRRTVRVDRQMITPSRGEPRFGPPTTPSSQRTVPLAQVTLDVLAAHLARFLAVDGWCSPARTVSRGAGARSPS